MARIRKVGTYGQIAVKKCDTRHAKAKVIEVNIEETAISSEVDCSLRGLAGEILPKLVG